jgi:hypothetical protein
MHNLPAWDIKSKPHTCRSQDSTKIPCVWGMHPIRRKRRRSNQWSLPGRLSGLTNSMHVLVLAGRPRGGRRRTSLVISPTRAARATLGARATVRTGRSTAALSVSKTYNRGVAYHGLAAGWWISGLLNGFGQVGGRRSATGGRVSWEVRAEEWGEHGSGCATDWDPDFTWWSHVATLPLPSPSNSHPTLHMTQSKKLLHLTTLQLGDLLTYMTNPNP